MLAIKCVNILLYTPAAKKKLNFKFNINYIYMAPKNLLIIGSKLDRNGFSSWKKLDYN